MNQLEGRGHYKCIGTMSGTSLDGLDLVYCEFVKSGDQWSFKILNSKSLSYDAPLRDDLFNAPSFDSERLMLLDRSIGKFFADAIQTFIRENSLQPDFISSHGHTIFHQPESLLTLQIGNGYVIAANTGIPVITDFRSLDVALSGQGAPLVPIGDHFLFSDYDIRLNLGGISNISLEKGNQTIAYDVSPANMILNYLTRKINLPFDQGGKLAREGNLHQDLFNQLNGISYYSLPYPKSLGFEYMRDNFFPLLDNEEIPLNDRIHTATKHISYALAKEIKALRDSKGKILVTGGGAYNDFLIDYLSEFLPQYVVHVPDTQIIDFKEALIFGFLGVLRLNHINNCLKSVTGASRDNCGGVVYYP